MKVSLRSRREEYVLRIRRGRYDDIVIGDGRDVEPYGCVVRCVAHDELELERFPVRKGVDVVAPKTIT